MPQVEAAQGGEWASGLNRQTDCAGERLEEFYQFRPQHPGMYRQIPWCRLFGIHRIIEVYLASRNTDWKNFHTHCVGEYHPPPVLVLFVPTERSEQDDGGHPHPSLVIHGPSHLRLSRIASSPSAEEILSPQPGLGRRAPSDLSSTLVPIFQLYESHDGGKLYTQSVGSASPADFSAIWYVVVRLKRHVVVYGARASSHSGDVSKAAPYFQPKGSRLCICFCMVSSPCLVLSLRHFGEVDFVHCPVSGVQSTPCERMFCHLLIRDLSFRFMLVAATPRCASRGEFPLMVQNQKVSPSR